MQEFRYLGLGVDVPASLGENKSPSTEELLNNIVKHNAYSGTLILEDYPVLETIVNKASWLYKSKLNLDTILAWGSCGVKVDNGKVFTDATIFLTDRNFIIHYKPLFSSGYYLDCNLGKIEEYAIQSDGTITLSIYATLYDDNGALEITTRHNGATTNSMINLVQIALYPQMSSFDFNENRRKASWHFALTQILENKSYPASLYAEENDTWVNYLLQVRRNFVCLPTEFQGGSAIKASIPDHKFLILHNGGLKDLYSPEIFASSNHIGIRLPIRREVFIAIRIDDDSNQHCEILTKLENQDYNSSITINKLISGLELDMISRAFENSELALVLAEDEKSIYLKNTFSVESDVTKDSVEERILEFSKLAQAFDFYLEGDISLARKWLTD